MISSTDPLKIGRSDLNLSSLLAQQISMWVIYQSPADWPGKYVARLWVMEPYSARFKPGGKRLNSDTLTELREEVRIGRSRLERHPEADPVIVECWL